MIVENSAKVKAPNVMDFQVLSTQRGGESLIVCGYRFLSHLTLTF